MRPSEALHAHRTVVRETVLKHGVRNARVFGSVLRGDDKENSDLDLLVEPGAGTTLTDIAAIQVELEQLLGVRVDVLAPNALPARIRKSVLTEAQPLGVALDGVGIISSTCSRRLARFRRAFPE